jgi:hypothetical protein
VTLARAATDTFTGIRPVDVPAIIAAQLAGAVHGEVEVGSRDRPEGQDQGGESRAGRERVRQQRDGDVSAGGRRP